MPTDGATSQSNGTETDGRRAARVSLAERRGRLAFRASALLAFLIAAATHAGRTSGSAYKAYLVALHSRLAHNFYFRPGGPDVESLRALWTEKLVGGGPDVLVLLVQRACYALCLCASGLESESAEVLPMPPDVSASHFGPYIDDCPNPWPVRGTFTLDQVCDQQEQSLWFELWAKAARDGARFHSPAEELGRSFAGEFIGGLTAKERKVLEDRGVVGPPQCTAHHLNVPMVGFETTKKRCSLDAGHEGAHVYPEGGSDAARV